MGIYYERIVEGTLDVCYKSSDPDGNIEWIVQDTSGVS